MTLDGRTVHMNRTEKLCFFHALEMFSNKQLEFYSLKIRCLSELAVERFCSDDFKNLEVQASLAELILIDLRKSNQFIRAAASNFRSPKKYYFYF